jgi:hypothetical protein
MVNLKIEVEVIYMRFGIVFDLKENKNEDERVEKFLKSLGFKPGQFFTWEEVEKKWREIAPNDDFNSMSNLFDVCANSNVLQLYFRFISNAELKELKEIQGRK